MDDELLHGFDQSLKKRGINNRLCYLQEASRFLKWLVSLKRDLAHLTPALANDYLCFRNSPTRCYEGLETIWNRICLFWKFLHSTGKAAADVTTQLSCRWVDRPGGFPAYQGALKFLFDRPYPMWKYHIPFFEPYADSHLRTLLKEGYARGSIQYVLRELHRLHGFVKEKGHRDFFELTPEILDSFVRERQRRHREALGRPLPKDQRQILESTLERFLVTAFDQNGRSFRQLPLLKDSAVLPDSLLNDYLDYGRVHRGLKPPTLRTHEKELLSLRTFLEQKGITDIKKMKPSDLDAYVLYRVQYYRRRGFQGVLGPLRLFFGFLYLNGHISLNPAQDLISPRRFRSDTRPKYLPWSRVEELVASIDRNSLVGKRDFAILALHAYHGLRTREVTKLQMNDLSLTQKNPHLILRERKQRGVVHLPLSQTATEALRDYLKVRPSCSFPEVFLTSQAPIHPVKCVGGITVRRMVSHFGESGLSGGSTKLRHSFAKKMLDQGATLPEIGALLGHRSWDSTLVYTRIDTEGLREVANNYANWL